MINESFNKSPNSDLLTIDEQLNQMAWALDLGFTVSPQVIVDGSLTGNPGCSTYNYRLTHPVSKDEIHYKFLIADHEEDKFVERVKQVCQK